MQENAIAIFKALIVAALIAACSTSIKAMIDIAVLENKVQTQKEILQEIKDDVKWIRQRFM